MSQFIKEFPDFLSKLTVDAYIYANSDVDVLVSLNEVGLLPEEYRVKAIESIRDLAVTIPDSGFLRDSIKTLMSDDELASILKLVRDNLLPDLDRQIDNWRSSYNGEDEPEAYFEELKSALDDYKNEFEDIELSRTKIEDAIVCIDQIVEDLKSEYEPEDDDGFWKRGEENTSKNSDNRSIFDDVDF